MEKERYSIMFSSVTGNTRMLAEAIRETLQKENCDYFGVCGGAEAKSELLYVGFWTDKGNADEDTAGAACGAEREKDISLRNGRLWRQRGIFQKGARPRSPVCRRQQYRHRRIYVSGQNAAGREGALSQDEGAAGAPGKS